MRNIIGQAVVGDGLYGRNYELARLWEHFDQGEHVLMLAPRRVGKTGLMLDLHRAPRENWDVINVDVEGGDGPEDCVAAMLAVQLFVSALRNACRGDSSLVSPETIDRCFDEQLAGESGTAHPDHYEKRLELALDEQECTMAHSILELACRSRDGVRLSDLGRLSRGSAPTFQSVLRDLKADGYVTEADRRLAFRSNLLRAWWRKHHGRRRLR